MTDSVLRLLLDVRRTSKGGTEAIAQRQRLRFAAIVAYLISYYAVTRGERWKTRAAQISGVMLFALCLGVLADVARRFIDGAEPVSRIMIVMTIIAAAINLVSL